MENNVRELAYNKINSLLHESVGSIDKEYRKAVIEEINNHGGGKKYSEKLVNELNESGLELFATSEDYDLLMEVIDAKLLEEGWIKTLLKGGKKLVKGGWKKLKNLFKKGKGKKNKGKTRGTKKRNNQPATQQQVQPATGATTTASTTPKKKNTPKNKTQTPNKTKGKGRSVAKGLGNLALVGGAGVGLSHMIDRPSDGGSSNDITGATGSTSGGAGAESGNGNQTRGPLSYDKFGEKYRDENPSDYLIPVRTTTR